MPYCKKKSADLSARALFILLENYLDTDGSVCLGALVALQPYGKLQRRVFHVLVSRSDVADIVKYSPHHLWLIESEQRFTNTKVYSIQNVLDGKATPVKPEKEPPAKKTASKPEKAKTIPTKSKSKSAQAEGKDKGKTNSASAAFC